MTAVVFTIRTHLPILYQQIGPKFESLILVCVFIYGGYLPGGFIIFGPRIRTYSQHQPLFRLVSHISLDCYSLFRPLHNGLYQRLCKGTNEYWSLFLQLIQNVFSSGRVAELANALLKIFTSASLICRLLYIFPSLNAFSPARFHQQIAFFNRQIKNLDIFAMINAVKIINISSHAVHISFISKQMLH